MIDYYSSKQSPKVSKRKWIKNGGKLYKDGQIKVAGINKNGKPRKRGYFQKGSKTSLILEHLQSGKQLSQLDCYPPSKFNTIRLGSIIKQLRDQGYNIKTAIVKNSSGSKHGVYYM